MKTSKIILTSLLSTIGLFILAVNAEIRVNGRLRNPVMEIEKNKIILPSFRVLYMTGCRNYEIVQNDSSYLQIMFPEDSIAPKINFLLKGDTLIIPESGSSLKNKWVKVHTTESLKKIILINSTLKISHLNNGVLSLDADKSNISFIQDKSGNSYVRMLDILGKNHSDVFATLKVDSVEVTLQNSKANLHLTAKKINGSLTDNSELYTHTSDIISLKKDNSSRIRMND
jgi:sulfur transfer complex TusBCD TusB component (DsrH family)